MIDSNWKKTLLVLIPLCMVLMLTACGGTATDGENEADTTNGDEKSAKTKVTLMLDWVPNTNHTGLYVAQEKGFFADAGLEVAIKTPAETTANQLVGSGEAEFGISSQEYVTQARAEGVPIVSIAAVLQHNTSGFASPKEREITEPKDFVGKTYGGWGAPIEDAFIKTVLNMDGIDVAEVTDEVNIINIGQADFFTATKRDIDFSWIYYGWTGIEAELRDFPINMIYLRDLDPMLDFYTPTLITNETMIQDHPEMVSLLVLAVSQGYEYAVEHPEEAANILIEATPEADPDLIHASQEWMSERYRDDAEQWGVQKEDTWVTFTEWMLEHELISKDIDPFQAFTNDFLPE